MSPATPSDTTSHATNEVKILFGPGGFVRITRFGDGRPPDEPTDITVYASAIASIGVTLPRAVAPPTEVNGTLLVSLGDGGRALWVDGGGDIDEADVSAAIAAALEQRGEEVIGAVEEMNRIRYAQMVSGIEPAMRRALTEAWDSRSKVSAFLRRPRNQLDGRSIRDVLADPAEANLDLHLKAIFIVSHALPPEDGARLRFLSEALECEP